MCKITFDSYLSESRRRKVNGGVACCSRACRNVHTSLLLGGDGSWVAGGAYEKKPSRPGWRKTRLEYLKSVGQTCEGCGDQTTVINVHHLHPTSDGGSLHSFDNLMAVCRDCHQNMHAQLREGAFDCYFEAVEWEARHAIA